MKLILCGFFCAGKTTLGRLAAEKLGIPFWDTDFEIESYYGNKKKIWEIHKKVGETEFRKLEASVLRKIPFAGRGVLSVGGGTLILEENRNILNKMGITVYLQASLSTIISRMQMRRFPSFIKGENPEQECEKIALKRFPIYELHCKHTIPTEQLTEIELVDTICLFYSEMCCGK